MEGDRKRTLAGVTGVSPDLAGRPLRPSRAALGRTYSGAVIGAQIPGIAGTCAHD
jgi:hypothetical protein